MSDETDTAVEMVYVVQMAGERFTHTGYGNGTAEKQSWVDIATVSVPPRTKRSTVIKRALAQANIAPNEDGSSPVLRALDADSFEAHEPEAHQPPMEWRL